MSGSVLQSGVVTPGHILTWVTNGVVQDGGLNPATVSYPFLNVKALGAKGDGTTDDTAVLEQIFSAGSGVYYFPSGTYRVTLSSTTILFVLASLTSVFGDGPTNTIIKPLAGSASGAIFGNTLRQTYFSGAGAGSPATSPAAQTDTDFQIRGIGFDFSALGAGVGGNIASFLLAQRILFENIAGWNGGSGAWSGIQFIGCDSGTVNRYTARGVTNAVDNWKGTTRTKVSLFDFEGGTAAGNGGLINFNGQGTSSTDWEASDDLTVSDGTFWLNSDAALFLDALGGGSSTNDAKINNVTIVAKTGATNYAIIGRGQGGRVQASNVAIRCLSGATMAQPVNLGASFGNVGPHTASGIVSTASSTNVLTITFPGTDVGPGSFIAISAAGGGALTGNGLTLNGYYPVASVSGSTITATVTGQTATGNGAISGLTTVQGFWGTFQRCSLSNITFDGCGASGWDLIDLDGSGHQVNGVTVTQNYNGAGSAPYRSIVLVDSTYDFGNASPQATVISPLIGDTGTGALQSGFSGNNRVQWNPGGAQPIMLSLTDAGTQAVSFTPVLQIGGASTGITYSMRAGEYTLIGNVCNFALRMVLSSKGTLTGALSITCGAMPGTAVNAVFVPEIFSGTGITSAVIATMPGLGTNTLGLSTQAGSQITDSNLTNTTAIYISGSFLTT
jgi:hypothetical protein